MNDFWKDLLGPTAKKGGEKVKNVVYGEGNGVGNQSPTSENPGSSFVEREKELARQKIGLYYDQKEAEFKKKCSSIKTKRYLMLRGKDWIIGGVVLLALMKVYDFVKSRKPKEHK